MKKHEETLLEIINTARNIECLYDNMNYQNKETFEKEILKEVEKENELLNSLELNEKNVRSIYNDFNTILEDTLYEDYSINIKNKELSNDLILKRFDSYIIKKFRPEPTRSTNKNGILDKTKDNIASIQHAAITDYNLSIIKFLTKLEETADTITIANKAISQRNKLLFTDKRLEERYFNEDFTIDGYDRCIKSNQKKEHVDFLYNKVLSNYINEQSTRCFLYSDSALEDREKSSDFAIDLQILKAGLYLMDTKDLQRAILQYKSINQPNHNSSINRIYICMQETKSLKDIECPKTIKMVQA